MKKIITLNSADYSYEVHQQKEGLPYLLMLHGFMGSGRVFNHLVKKLYTVCNPVTIDLLGHGQSQKLHNPERYAESCQIGDIITFVQSMELSPLFLYGYSMGGRLALKTALEAPDIFKGLILESTTYGISDVKKRAERRQADARRANEIKADYPQFLSKWEALDLFKSPITTDRQLATAYKKIHLEQDPEAMAASLLGFGSGVMEPARKRQAKFSKPVMIIAGTADQKYIKISTRLASYFANSQVCHIPAGHRVHLDNPAKLTKQLIHFIEQNSTS